MLYQVIGEHDSPLSDNFVFSLTLPNPVLTNIYIKLVNILCAPFLSPCPQYILWVSDFPIPFSSLYTYEFHLALSDKKYQSPFCTSKTSLLLTYYAHGILSIFLLKHVSAPTSFLIIYGGVFKHSLQSRRLDIRQQFSFTYQFKTCYRHIPLEIFGLIWNLIPN